MFAGSIANAVLFYGLAIGTCDDQVPMVRVGRHYTPNDASRPLVRAKANAIAPANISLNLVNE
jgi:hypothetical protein